MRKKTIEEYLEIIYVLQERYVHAHTGEIANLLNIKAPSVSEMLIKLEKKGLIVYEPYKGSKLTKVGLKIVMELATKHKTLSAFLQMIGVDKDTAELDACRIEHQISDDSIEKLIKFLEFINAAPDRPRWLVLFNEFLKTGVRENCRPCISEKKEVISEKKEVISEKKEVISEKKEVISEKKEVKTE
ncbi:MAG: metal-dependent transcriptional regulator [Candidatus Helarchaeota archaeon]